MIQVLLVDERAQAGELFGRYIEHERDMELVACVPTAQEGISFAGGFNVAVLSLTLPEDGAFELTNRFHENEFCAQVMILSPHENQGLSMRIVEAGALACIARSAPPQDILHAIRCVSRGEALISPALAGNLIARLIELHQWIETLQPDPVRMHELTRREREILYFLSQDFSNQDIAAQLIIEVGTVKNHVHNILEKLNVNNRHEAALYLLRQRGETRRTPRTGNARSDGRYVSP